ncbi:MAG: tRNA epoxyqueuosine(34) reductase QueG [Bacteroidota bacterium]
MISPDKYKEHIRSKSLELGFQYCGFAKAEKLDEDARRLEQWLSKGMHGNMSYMENYFDLRIDPTKLVPGAKIVITLMLNYYPSIQQNVEAPKISKYAYGNDYHNIIREKLKTLLNDIKTNIGDINGRGFVDSAPVLERSWALKSGLGWVGKNGNLITRQSGSFFFIATLITDLQIEPDAPFNKDYCGTCTACIDQCPTEAILPNKVVDGSKCISYFTIELKDALIPDTYKGKFDHWMFGCDTCQDVCPWNRFSKPHNENKLQPLPEILNLSLAEWEAMSEEKFKEIFKESPLSRSKFAGIQRNIKFLKINMH